MAGHPNGWPAPFPDWLTIRRGEPSNQVNISQLDEERKQRFWQAMKERKPELAELLTDPNLRELAEAFGADICIAREDFDGLDR